MKAKILSEPIDKMPSDTLLLSIFSDEKPLKGANGLIDWRQCGRISRLLMDGVITGEYMETALVLSSKRKMSPRIIVVGLGDAKDFNEEKLAAVSRHVAQKLKKLGVKKVSLAIPGSSYFPQDYKRSTEIIITAFADSYDKNNNLFEMVIFETGKRINIVYQGAKEAKDLLKNNLLLTLDA